MLDTATTHGPAGDAPTSPDAILTIRGLSKRYGTKGATVLRNVSLDIRRGEIFALLGPNGAGKTTLISIVCGIVNASEGRVTVDGHDIAREYRAARSIIGLVPQELTTDAFETVWATVSYSRGLFGCPPDPAHIERILRQLTLWDKRDAKIMTLSGGMKRRVLIAKALSHEPRLLFLDEPTAGVDVRLRQEMWEVVRELRQSGVTVILTTHYIEEAEEMADRVGVIRGGELLLVEEKEALMEKLGHKALRLELDAPLAAIPEPLRRFELERSDDGRALTYNYNTRSGESEVGALLAETLRAGLSLRDVSTRQSSLEEIFVTLVGERA